MRTNWSDSASAQHNKCELCDGVVQRSIRHRTVHLAFCHTTPVLSAMPFLCFMQVLSVSRVQCFTRAKSWRYMPRPQEAHYTSADTGANYVLSVPTTCPSIKNQLETVFCAPTMHSVTQLRCTVYFHFCALCKRSVYQQYIVWHKWSSDRTGHNNTYCIASVPSTDNIGSDRRGMSNVASQSHSNALIMTQNLHNMWWNTWCAICRLKRPPWTAMKDGKKLPLLLWNGSIGAGSAKWPLVSF